MAVGVSAVFAADVVTAGMVATAVADAGMALSVVGAVTGNSDLTKLGGVMGLAGGIGGLINGGSFASMGSDIASSGNDAAGFASLESDAANAGSSAGLSGADSISNAWESNFPTNTATGIQVQDSAIQNGTAQGGTAAVQGAGGNVNPVTGQVNSAAPAAAATGDPTGMSGNYASDGQTAGSGVDAGPARAQQGLMSQLASQLGSTWSKLDPRVQAEIAKSVMAVPGGIQNQANVAKQLAISQQNADANTARVAQTSYGNQVPGLINKAQVA